MVWRKTFFFFFVLGRRRGGETLVCLTGKVVVTVALDLSRFPFSPVGCST